MIILSILIPVIPARYSEFMKLLNNLQRQVTYMHQTHYTLGLIEILFDDSPAFLDGGMSIGAKRNVLRKRAEGKYSVFIDSDDYVAPNYVETLVRLCQQDKDVVTYRCLFKNDSYWSILNMTLDNVYNEETSPERIIQRGVWHVCPIKTEHTMRANFNDDLNHGEDVSFIEKVLPYLKTETHTDMILTQYNHSEKNSEADKILKAGYK